MRVRCSQGLEVEAYLGAFYKRPNNVTDVDLPGIDCDKAILVRLQVCVCVEHNCRGLVVTLFLQSGVSPYTTPSLLCMMDVPGIDCGKAILVRLQVRVWGTIADDRQ